MGETRKLYRSMHDRQIAGVCGGLAEYLNTDPTLVRLVFVALTLLGGPGLLLYIIAWVIMPRKPEGAVVPAGEGRPPAPDDPMARAAESGHAGPAATGETAPPAAAGGGEGRIIGGAILILLGTLFLAERLAWWHWPHATRLSHLWPIALIVIGVAVNKARLRDRG